MDLRQELNTTLGLYSPSFFKMQVNRDESLSDLNSVSEVTLCIYFHEYIHFIQDISTVYGLLNTSMVVNYIKLAGQIINSEPKIEFEVPIDFGNDKYQVGLNLNLRRVYLGSGNAIENVITPCEISVIDSAMEDPTLQNPFVKEILINNQENIYYKFGDTYIMESMAYIAESTLFPSLIPSPCLPYKSAEILTEEIYPSFSANRLNVFALCDASLMMFHPGKFYYDTLLDMKQNNFIPENPRNVYEYLAHVTFNYEGVTDTNALLAYMSEKTRNNLRDYFTIEQFDLNRQWIMQVFDRALTLRKENISFLIDILEAGELKRNPVFISIFQLLGSPLTINNFGEATFHPGSEALQEVRIDLFWAINQIYKVLIGYQRCEMKSYCQASADDAGLADFTDSRCNNAPWTRSSDAELCSFGQLWKVWGFSGKIPTP